MVSRGPSIFRLFRRKPASCESPPLEPTRELVVTDAPPCLFVPMDDGGPPLQLRFGNAQHIGSREQQQDSFGYSNVADAGEAAEKGVLAILADGMGGLQNGAQISDYVVGAMLSMFASAPPGEEIPGWLCGVAEQINRQVCGAFDRGNAGSTLAAAFLHGGELFWVCAGDSRIYLYRNRALYQLNEDHSYLNDLLRSHARGRIPLAQARSSEQGHALTSYIGNPDLPRLDFNRRGFSLRRDDKLLLCSDGVYSAVNNAGLIECMRNEPHAAAENIIRAVLAKRISGQDNATAMVIEMK